MIKPEIWVTACIPAFRCNGYLRGAVMSLLSQTYPFLRVIVINDGDPQPPWPALADISDPRLIRFDLSENRGPYFALAIALNATPDSLFLIQDADDWSAPERVAVLLRLLQRDRSSYAYSTLAQFHDDPAGGVVVDRPLYWSALKSVPGSDLSSRIPHHGLFRTEALTKLGGYFGGFRFGYDELLTNLVLLTGTVSWSPERLYWRRLRTGSLTHSADTGMMSVRRESLRVEMRALYRHAFRDYQAFTARRISGQQLLQSIRSRVQARRGAEDSWRIQVHAARLRHAMNAQSRLYRRHSAFAIGFPGRRTSSIDAVDSA